MTRAVTEALVDASEVAAILLPRSGLVAERAADLDPVEQRHSADERLIRHFELVEGPLDSYRRRVAVDGTGPGPVRVHQEVEFGVGVPYFSWLFVLPLRSALGAMHPRASMPWWAPPQRLPRRAAVVLATLCALTVLAGYLADLLPDTMTYAASEFGVGHTGQGVALGVVQVNAVLALGLLMLADRRGRRPLILATSVAGTLLTGAGALAPSLALLTASQVLAGAALTAMFVLLGVVAAEEMPAGARAWAIGVMSMCFGLGSGAALLALPLADFGSRGWRWLFALGLLALPGIAGCARSLPESQRFRHRAIPSPPHRRLSGVHRRRLLVIGLGSLLFALFATPAGQFQNEFLRHERHYSALRISVLEQVAGTIGGLGVLVGGRLADTRGRRPVAAIGVALGAATTLATYLSRGVALWVWSIVNSVLSYGVTPALSVYGPELFPTSWRGRASGAVTILSAAGGIIGLVAVGVLSGAIGTLGPALAIAAVGPLGLVVLIVVAYPETARRELEDLNPEDRPAR